MNKKKLFIDEDNQLKNKLKLIKKHLSDSDKLTEKPYFYKLSYTLNEKDKRFVYLSEFKEDYLLELDIVPWTSPIGILKDYEIGEVFERGNRSNKLSYKLDAKTEMTIEEATLLKLFHFNADENFSITRNDVMRQKEETSSEKKKYKLESIVSQIKKEQNEIVRSDIDKPLILKGPPGSGKTIIGAHRIVYLLNEFPEQFRTNNIGVFVYNISLKTFLENVFPSLGIENINIESIDSWAYCLISDSVKNFNISSDEENEFKWIKTRGFHLKALKSYLEQDNSNDEYLTLLNKYYNSEIFDKSLTEHIYSVSSPFNIDISSFVTKQNQNLNDNIFTYEDVTLLLCMIYHREPERLPGYSHIFIDEAQDMSSLQIMLLYSLLSESKSMSVAGDLDQQLYPYKSFNSWNDVFHPDEITSGLLTLHHRMTYETARFSNAMIGKPPPKTASKKGELPVVKKTNNFKHFINFVAKEIRAIKEEDPQSSITILQYSNTICESVLDKLRDKGIDCNFAKRDSWEFGSVVNVSNYYQVKGLEFDYVFIAGIDYYMRFIKSEKEMKHLYVAMTRTIKKLYMIYQNEMPEQIKKIDESFYTKL